MAAGDLSFMGGVPELLVLRLLQHREMYGYEIVRAISEATGRVIDVGEGTVYPILHAMEKRKWVTAARKTLDGRTRIYYRLTERGRQQFEQTAGRWAEISSAVNRVLGARHEPEPGV
jgi:PadR family transcriptional regulator PadR